MSLNNIEVEEQQTKKKKSPVSFIISLIALIILLLAAFETIIAYLNFSAVEKEEKPKYLYTERVERDGNTTYTIYDMRLYRIVRKDEADKYEIKLMPFFMNYK